MRSIIALAVLLIIPSLAMGKEESGPDNHLRNLACRIVALNGEPLTSITPLMDTYLNTLSLEPSENSFSVDITKGRKLGAMVRHVLSRLPRDRFNVTLLLEGKPITRVNHIDLDIYVETVIDEVRYALHCFSDAAK